jgi:RNA polymerase sigma-70 factor (ECF subfamily)
VATEAEGRAAAEHEFGQLGPYPDRLLDELAATAPDPAAATELRESVELALMAAVQLLPARQRAVLVLREVLGWPAADVADLLDTSVAGVNSALQRARAAIDRAHATGRMLPAHSPTSEADEKALVGRLVRAWNAVDIDGLVGVLTEDALLTMPPQPMWFQGRAAIGQFFATVPAEGRLDRIRLLPTRANGQPALAAYTEDAEGVYRAYGIMVLTVRDGAIAAITGFSDQTLFSAFGLPDALPA